MMATRDYEFVCVGRLSPLTVETIHARHPKFEDARTTVVIPIRDPAELHGTLAHLEALGIELVAMRQLQPDTASTDGPRLGAIGPSTSSSEEDPGPRNRP